MENIWTFPFGLCKILARVKGVLSGSGQKSDRCKFTCANMFRTQYVSTQTNQKICSYVLEPQKKKQRRIPKALQTISFSRNEFQRSEARSFYRGNSMSKGSDSFGEICTVGDAILMSPGILRIGVVTSKDGTEALDRFPFPPVPAVGSWRGWGQFFLRIWFLSMHDHVNCHCEC